MKDGHYIINNYLLFTRNKRMLNKDEKKEINYYFNLRHRDNAVNIC